MELGFGSKEKKGFEGFGSKREEWIWGVWFKERRRDLGGLVEREKKGFRVLIQHRRNDFE